MATEARTKQTNLWWADMEDDNAGDLAYLLPPKEVIGPDENGIKKVIEYKFNEEGKQVKVTTTTRVRKYIVNSRRMERILERRSNWGKFGDAVGDDDHGSQLTMVSTEQISLERSIPEAAEDSSAQQGKVGGGAVLMVCRACGKKGEHWTARCPYKDIAPVPPPAENGIIDKTSSAKTKYVPPSKRAGTDRNGTNMRQDRDDENSVRVTNLSEDTREADLRELFEAFGKVSRVHVALGKKSGMCKGYGFVKFAERKDAMLAILKLNGYPYDNLILDVDWAATPRSNKLRSCF